MKGDPYKRIAGFYDKFVEPVSHSLRKYGLKIAPPRKGMRVLEVGCGTGSNLELYLQDDCEVYGIDMSPSMLKHAETKLGAEVMLHLGDASNMPYEDDFFDLVIVMLTLHEMPDKMRQPVLGEIKRVVKMEGRIMLIDYHPGPYIFPMGWITRMIIWFFEIAAGIVHFRNFRNFIANNGLSDLLEKGNLQIQKERILGGGNITIVLAKRNH